MSLGIYAPQFFNVFKMKCIPVMAKLNFQQFPVLHDHSEIILKCFDVQETFINIINVKHSCAV